jgi:hypothetical protein
LQEDAEASIEITEFVLIVPFPALYEGLELTFDRSSGG